ncbi:MAG TPA: hypothetical protein VIH93_02860 [Thermoanaerobaculia bacterium]
MESMERRVVLGSGHRVDGPGRKSPRFPPEKETAVREALARQLAEWGVGTGGTGDLAICGGANGADILLAEICRDRGAGVLLLLPFPPERFIQESVELPGTDWTARFRALARDGRCEVRIQEQSLGPLPPGDNPFERNNEWILRTGLDEARPGKPAALLVWDRKPGDGAGGTAGFHDAAVRLDLPVVVVDPSTL